MRKLREISRKSVIINIICIMELRQLRYFAMVAKTLNFSDAAKALYITQGTLSQQIKQLEDELGTLLFHRSSHSVSITEAGEEILPIVQKALDASEECRNKVSDLKNALSGTLSIGLTSSFKDLLTDTVRNFIKAYPGVKLNIYYKTAVELLEMLENKEIDFILAFKPAVKYNDVESEELFTSDLSVVMHKDHPLADCKMLTMAELKRHKMIIPGSGLQARKAFERFVDLDTADLNIMVELNDPNIIIELLHRTKLISILSSLAVHYDPSLVAIPLKETPRKMVGCVHWLKNSYRKRSAEKFVEMLKDSISISD